MRPKYILKKLFLASFLILFSLFIIVRPAFAIECAPGLTTPVCPEGTYCRPCDPPSLPQLEVIGAQTVGLIWVFGGIIFFGLFIYNAYLYMFNKVEDSKKRMTQWIIGLMMILFSQPLVSIIMGTLVSESSTCYDSLKGVNLTFFFPNVCTSDQEESTTPP